MKQERKMVNLSENAAAKAEGLKLSVSNQIGMQLSWSQLFELLHAKRDQITASVNPVKENLTEK